MRLVLVFTAYFNHHKVIRCLSELVSMFNLMLNIYFCTTLQSVNGLKGHTVTDDHQNFTSEMHQFPSDTNQQEYTHERDQPRLECVNAPIYENKYNDIG